MIASAAKGGGTKTSEASAPVSATASRTVSKIGRFSSVSPPLPGVTPPTTLVPFDHLLGVELADAAGHALHEDGVVLSIRMAMMSPPQAALRARGRAATAASAASASVSAVMIGRPLSAMIF
jgi:hypothetical protein